jgi:ABC-type transporter Mla MlaB component
VHLCGQFTGEYVVELRKTLSPESGDVGKIALDLSNVTFVDREAMVFLCGVKSRISIENIPSYVTRWIEQEGRCGSSVSGSREE